MGVIMQVSYTPWTHCTDQFLISHFLFSISSYSWFYHNPLIVWKEIIVMGTIEEAVVVEVYEEVEQVGMLTPIGGFHMKGVGVVE